MRNICDAYMQNYKKGLRTSQTLDSALSNNDLAAVDNAYENNTTIVDSVVQKVTIPILTNGVNLQIISQAKDIAGISLSDCRYYISKMLLIKIVIILEVLYMLYYLDTYTMISIMHKI